MIGVVFMGLTALLYICTYLINKLPVSEKRAVLAANLILLAAGYGFVVFTDWRFAVVLLAMSVSTWLFAGKKCWFVGVVLAVCALGFFKYTNFFAESFARLFGRDFTALNIILPLGISFYTFSAIGYLVDVKRGKVERRGLLDVALYLSFYPKLTSGPIQRSGDFFAQSSKKRGVGAKRLSEGAQVFVIGMFKKIVIADRLSVFVDQVYSAPKAFGSATVLLAVVAYSLQIYFDFSGYSDMAIGSAKVLGFDLPANFDLPYVSHNVTELWKRWHISLSSWLGDYLYIPLGGNRKGKARTYLNLFLTMAIGGLWHGASLTFIVWGALHGLALAAHKLCMTLTGSRGRESGRVAGVVSVILTFAFTSFCWIFFRAESLSQAGEIIASLFSFRAGIEQPYFWTFVALAVLLCATAVAWYRSRGNEIEGKSKNVSRIKGYYPTADLGRFWGIVYFLVLTGLTLGLAYTGGSPFIYGSF